MLPFEKGETKCPLPSLLLPAMSFGNPGAEDANRQISNQMRLRHARQKYIAAGMAQIQKLAADLARQQRRRPSVTIEGERGEQRRKEGEG